MTVSQFELRLRTILEAYSLPGKLIVIGVETPRVYLKDAAGNVLLATGNVVPTAATAGYAKGCLFIKTDATSGTRGLYENAGTTTSCLFLSSGAIRAQDTLITAGKILYGVGGVGAEKTLSITVAPQTSVAKLFEFINPDAEGVGVHAAVAEGAANAFPGPFTSPAIPRSLKIDFAAGWQGGDVTVIGTNQFDVAVTEVFADNPGAVVQGTEIFKTVVSASKEIIAGAADTCTLLTGEKIGIPSLISAAFGILTCSAVVEAVTVDATYPSFIPTTAPTGLVSYALLVNVPHSATPVFT